MKIYQTWKRNKPDTQIGESISVTLTYYSFDSKEIDELEKKLPNGVVVMDYADGENKE